MKPPNIVLLVTCSLALTIGLQTADAKVYKWTDENGKTVYSQTPPPAASEQEVEEVKLRGAAGGSSMNPSQDERGNWTCGSRRLPSSRGSSMDQLANLRANLPNWKKNQQIATDEMLETQRRALENRNKGSHWRKSVERKKVRRAEASCVVNWAQRRIGELSKYEGSFRKELQRVRTELAEVEKGLEYHCPYPEAGKMTGEFNVCRKEYERWATDIKRQHRRLQSTERLMDGQY